MKLNYKSILAAAALMVTAANANAGMVYDWYAGATAGIGTMVLNSNDHNHSHTAYSYGAVFGIDLPVVRFEGEYDYLDSKRLDMQTLMGNAYVKLPGLVVINPYIGVGVGIMFDAQSDHNYGGNYQLHFDSTIAYQGMLGATLNIPALPFKIDFEGRALFLPEIYSKDGTDIDATQFDARVKLRYVF